MKYTKIGVFSPELLLAFRNFFRASISFSIFSLPRSSPWNTTASAPLNLFLLVVVWQFCFRSYKTCFPLSVTLRENKVECLFLFSLVLYLRANLCMCYRLTPLVKLFEKFVTDTVAHIFWKG